MLLGWLETKLWTVKYGSKSIQTSLISRKRPPKPYKLLKFFISFVTTVKSCHAPAIWKKMRWKSLCLLILKSITEIIKYFKSLYDFGGRCVKIKDVCMDFEPYFKVHNLVSLHPKSVILGQMTNRNMIFHVVVSVYRLVKILKLAPVPCWISERLMENFLIKRGPLSRRYKWPTKRNMNSIMIDLLVVKVYERKEFGHYTFK